ncbi:MAG: phosphoribosylformylglycinamidine synthase I [Armatimonadetes bacterium]|nr:MAG: phosphoribosylformylglycinamidine synthase I [Armatimonadota bacterium]
MKAAIVQIPGSNCDQDALFGLRGLGIETEYVWHASDTLTGFDLVVIPGGFTYGDYLRCGAIAARAPVMDAVRQFAEGGGPVIGICNGFQVLIEAGLLPGALLPNVGQRFLCRTVHIKAVNRESLWTQACEKPLAMPIAHNEGRYVAEEETLKRLSQENRIAFVYCTPTGEVTEEANPNGSVQNIAGVLNERGNVLGMMPHPERAILQELGSTDGRCLFDAFAHAHAT